MTAPVEQFYRIMGDVVLARAGAISSDSLTMPICYPEYVRCFDFGQTFIPVAQKVTINQDEVMPITFTIRRWLLEPADGATSKELQPAFLWNAFPGAVSYTINVFNLDDYLLVWTASGLKETSIVYNFDGQGKALQPNRHYSWRIVTDAGIASNRQAFSTVDPTGSGVPFFTVDQGFYSGITSELTTVVRDEEAWLALWSKHTGMMLPATTLPPAVDFSRDMVIGIFAGQKPSGGFAININSITGSADGQISVDYSSAVPGAGCVVTMALTSPYQIVTLPYSDSEVVFHKTDIINDCLAETTFR